jgi:hypothetical protein
MRQNASGLPLALLLFAVTACAGPPPAPPPTFVPDRIATGVAVAQAVAATLTAGAPTITLVPSATVTIVPGKTPPVKPTDTPTPAASPTQTPEPTPTIVASVFGDEYGIKVVSVERVDSVVQGLNAAGGVEFRYPPTGEVFLKVGILFSNSEGELGGPKDIRQLSIVDSQGQSHLPDFEWVLVGTRTTNTDPAQEVTLIFPVPETATGLKLLHGDLPLIDLVPSSPTVAQTAVATAAAPSILTPTSTAPAPIPAKTGTVRGVAIDKASGRPMSYEQVVLVAVESPEKTPLTHKLKWSYDPDDKTYVLDNSALTDITGAFIMHVPPGTYALMSPSPDPPLGGNSFGEDSSTGAELIITVLGEVTLDLGRVQLRP